MRRWKVIIIDWDTGNQSRPGRFFRRHNAQLCADQCNGRFSTQPCEEHFSAMVINQFCERRIVRRLKYLGCR